MTIEEMINRAKVHMNSYISCLSKDLVSSSAARAALCAYFYVGLVSDDEYSEYCDLIRLAENKRIFTKQKG